MARVTVRMVGVAKEVAGTPEQTLTIPLNSNVSTIIQALIEEHGDPFRDAILDPSTQTPVSTIILLNGVETGNLQGLDTPVTEGDTIVLLSVTHGG
jgi:molybdopterin converting factor small subunit